MLETIQKIDNFLSEDEFKTVETEVEKFQWKLTGGEYMPEHGTRVFWYKDLAESQVIDKMLKDKVEKILDKKISTHRLYANGQSHGQCAWPHQDVTDDAGDGWGSLIFYIHKPWWPHYGGHLIFIDPNNGNPEVYESIFPKTNTAVLFDSRRWHLGIDPTVYCLSQRISIAYKFKIES